MYLPGDENAQLRRGFYQQLEMLKKAREAIYGDIDDVINGPCGVECDTLDDLLDTAPTTMAGLLAFLIYMHKAHTRDPEVVADHHLEPMIEGLRKAAAALS